MCKFHSVFLSVDGRVFTCGHGRGGRLGHGNEKTLLVILNSIVHTIRVNSVTFITATCVDTCKCYFFKLTVCALFFTNLEH